MSNDPSWDDILDGRTAVPAGDPAGALARAAAAAPQPGPADGVPKRVDLPPRKRKRRRWPWIVVAVILVVGLVGAATVWTLYEDKVRELLGWELENDHAGAGNGEEVIVVIQSGDIGSDVAMTLYEAGVTMSYEAFYELLLERPEVSFVPGNFLLQREMSAEAALEALLDPASRVENRVTIPEGSSYHTALDLVAAGTEIPLDELQAAAEDPTSFGVPAAAHDLEGYLFPATYTFDPGTSARDAIQRMVDEMFTRLAARGVAPEDSVELLIKASIIQREAGRDLDDFPKVARVFENRLDQGWLLESDATVTYGTGNFHSVWTSPEERADASNPYNTYANPGLPVGAIGLPGEVAIDAALNPAEGDWMFFVTVNLQTGETVFSVTIDQHEAAAQQLYAWCRDVDNAIYCD